MTRTKPRGDSKLKTLAPDKQALIVEWMNTGTRDMARARVRKEFGVETNGASLSEFYSWFHLSRHLEEAADFAEDLKRTMTELPGLHLDEEQIGRAAQVAFELQAAKSGDTDAFVALRRVRQRDEIVRINQGKLEIDQRKMELLEAAAKRASEAETVVRSTMTPEEQRERLKQIFGM